MVGLRMMHALHYAHVTSPPCAGWRKWKPVKSLSLARCFAAGWITKHNTHNIRNVCTYNTSIIRGHTVKSKHSDNVCSACESIRCFVMFTIKHIDTTFDYIPMTMYDVSSVYRWIVHHCTEQVVMVVCTRTQSTHSTHCTCAVTTFASHKE